jgi:hypothetical protein
VHEVNGESKGGDGRGNAASECEGSDGQFMQGLRMARKRDGRAAMGVKSSAWEGHNRRGRGKARLPVRGMV